MKTIFIIYKMMKIRLIKKENQKKGKNEKTNNFK